MPAAKSPSTSSSSQRGLLQWLTDMPAWKKVSVGAALLAVAAGGALSLAAGEPAATLPISGTGTGSGLSSALIEGQPRPAGMPNQPVVVEEPASRGVFRLGFSFLAGFCIGSFLRAALRVAAIALGFWLFATFALAYYGLVTVDWVAIDSLWNRFAANVEREWGSFQTFVTGSLPAAALVVTGLAFGLKRH